MVDAPDDHHSQFVPPVTINLISIPPESATDLHDPFLPTDLHDQFLWQGASAVVQEFPTGGGRGVGYGRPLRTVRPLDRGLLQSRW